MPRAPEATARSPPRPRRERVLRAVAGAPPVAATFSSTPMAASSTIMFELPKEMNGSGTPVSGASPITANRLSTAWPRMSEVIPAATSLACRSRASLAVRRPP